MASNCVQDVPSLLVLPNELLLQIVSLLRVDDLRTCTRVSSLFKELAAPLYFGALNFDPKDSFWITVDHKNCEALLVWRRMARFTALRSLYISLGSSQDHHFRALDLFFRSPQCANIPAVYLSCYEAPTTSTYFVNLVEGIRESGCREICYSGRSRVPHSQGTIPKSTQTIHSRLESFSADCNTVFSPPLLSFTVTTLHHSPLKDLILNDTGLSPSRWTKLLSTLDLPNLRHLEVDPQCPLRALLNFLQRHRRIDFLQVAPHGKQGKSCLQLPCVKLPSLRHLGGPPAYVAKLVARLETPGTICSLSLTLLYGPSHNHQLSKVLDCTKYLDSLRNVHIYFPAPASDVAFPMASLRFPKSESRTCGATHLRISCAHGWVTDTEGDILVSAFAR
jgi:hypothetical protein